MIFLYTLNYIYIYYNNLCKFLNINWGRKKQTAVESNFNNLICFILYTNMSGYEAHEPYSGIEEEQKIGKLDESVGQGGAVEGLGAMQETGSVAEVEDEERETHAESMPEHEEEKEKPRPHRKKKAKSRKKEQEYSLTNIGKRLEKQTNYLARLEQVLQPLRKLAKSSEVQSKLVKDINTSVKQMERQIVQVRKGIQKGKTKKK